MNKKNWLVLSCLGFLGFTAGQSFAADGEATATYTRYHEAVRVVEICRMDNRNQGITKESPATWSKISRYIDAKVNNSIGAGERLTLIEQAKSDAWRLVERNGCKSEEVASLMAIYDKELASL